MAKFVRTETRLKIREVVGSHNKVYRWRRVDCVTLAVGVLEAQGIIVDQDRLDVLGVLGMGTHDEAMSKIREAHPDMSIYLGGILDAIPQLKRVESPYDWEVGMVGLTPQEGTYHVGFRLVDAADVGGSTLGVVDDRNVPVVVSPRGIVPVSKLWPRWTDARTLTQG